MNTYTHKPTKVQAIQFTFGNLAELDQWLTAELGPSRYWLNGSHLVIETNEGDSRDCPVGYWVIKGVRGLIYPVAPEVFEESYRLTPKPKPAIAASG